MHEPQDWRNMLGLAGAHNGDLAALNRLLRFISSEFQTLDCEPGVPEQRCLPEEVRQHLGSIAREMGRLQIFVDGYIAGAQNGLRAAPRPLRVVEEGADHA